MRVILLILFFMMIPPALITVTLAARSLRAMIWNYSWFLIMAQVGLLAFGSHLGSFPALFFALLYTMRVLGPKRGPTIDPNIFMRFPGGGKSPFGKNPFGDTSGPFEEKGPRKEIHESGDVIEAEFRKERPETREQRKANGTDAEKDS